MKPNPRSETNFLMVPVGISLLPSRNNVANARALSRTSTTAAHIACHPGDLPTLPPKFGIVRTSKSHHDNPCKGGHRSREFHRYSPPLAQPPDAPHSHPDDGAFAHWGDDGQGGQAERPQDQQVAAPHEDADQHRLGAADRHCRDRLLLSKAAAG